MAYLFTTTPGEYNIFCDAEGTPVMIDYRRSFRKFSLFLPHKIRSDFNCDNIYHFPRPIHRG